MLIKVSSELSDLRKYKQDELGVNYTHSGAIITTSKIDVDENNKQHIFP